MVVVVWPQINDSLVGDGDAGGGGDGRREW